MGTDLLTSGMQGTVEETYHLERELAMDLQEDEPRAKTTPKDEEPSKPIKSTTERVKQW